MTKALRVLLSNRVQEDEIDELGHLSVPFYESRALESSRRLVELTGCPLDAGAEAQLELTLVDAYLRNLREQFLDSPLLVRGGFIGASDCRLRIYQELVNSNSGDLAATFVHEFELQHQHNREPVPYDDSVIRQALADRVEVPEHGRPRSLDLDAPTQQLSLAEVKKLNLASTRPRAITPEECTANGLLKPEMFSHLPYSGLSVEDQTMEWVFETTDGRTLGIADLESRNVLYRLPSLGNQIQTYSATVKIGPKVFQRVHWIFNLDSNDLISWASTVALPLDLDARRSMDLPADMRSKLLQDYHPELL